MFGLKFTIEPEIELEVCASEDKSYKWNWELPSLLASIYKSLEDLVAIKQLDQERVDPTYKLITKPWRNEQFRGILQDKFPLLNVKDLDTQIVNSLALFKDHKGEYLKAFAK